MNPFAKYSTSSLGRSAAFRVALGVAVAGAAVLGVARDASADIVVGVRPPVPRVEVIPRAPSPQHAWVHGYWGYHPHGYAWTPGYWQAPRAGYAWEGARWEERGGRYHFHEGRWHHR